MTKDHSEYYLSSESITGAVVGDHPVVNMYFGGRQGSESLGDILSLIPVPPEPYTPHPYAQLTSRFVGRQKEINFLTDWVAKPDSDIYKSSVLCVVALGGMGKSALTWKWFNDDAPQEMSPLAGRLWWSFYENSSYEEFLICSLAYVLGVSEEKILKELEKVNGNKDQINHLITRCEDKLLGCLKKQSFLLVLDGLERMLNAYALRDIARVADEDLDEHIEEEIAGREQTSIKQTEEIIKRARRQTTDPRMGRFLTKLAIQPSQSRILVSTRLFPQEWISVYGEASVGCYHYRLEELHEDDALDLWRACKIKGSRDVVQPYLASFRNHPLLIKLLAGVIKKYRRAPGDFEQWRQSNSTFDPFSLEIKQVKSDILKFALQDLDQISRRVLQIIAGFRIPPSYEQVIDLLVGEGKPITTEAILEQALQDLEDRGLLGWDRDANRYEMHPVVRGVMWSVVAPEEKRSTFLEIQTYIDKSLPSDLTEETIKAIDVSDLNKVVGSLIEKYDKLIELGEYDLAFPIFNLLNVLDESRLGGCVQKLELLSMFFPQGHTYDPCLSDAKIQARATYLLGTTLTNLGQIEYATALLHRAAIQFARELLGTTLTNLGQIEYAAALFDRPAIQFARELDLYNVCETLNQRSYCFLCAGKLRELEATTRQTLLVAREQRQSYQESVSLFFMAQGFLVQKRLDEAKEALKRLSSLTPDNIRFYAIASWLAFEEEDYSGAFQYATKEFELGQYSEFNMLIAAKTQGQTAIRLGHFSVAEKRLNFALDKARSGNFIEQEVQAQISLAELRCQQGNLSDARALLDEIWEKLGRGSLNISYADALNVLAQIEYATGNEEAARNAAIKAFKFAWCNGVPYHYERGLKDTCNHLVKVKDLQLDESSSFEVVRVRLIECGFLQASDLPLFNEADYEPLEEVEINSPPPPGITAAKGWTDEQIIAQLKATKQVLDWENTTGSARKWWEAFENENKHRLALVLRLAEELRNRKATITEFFLAYVYSNTDNIQANLHYLDYTRLKEEEEKRKTEASKAVSSDKYSDSEESTVLSKPDNSNETLLAPEKSNLGNASRKLIQGLTGASQNAKINIPITIIPGITDTKGWTDEQIIVQLEATKKILDWENASGSARKRWEAFENENKHRLALVLRLAEELRNRKATITEFFSAFVTDDIQANLHYLDYTRLKKEARNNEISFTNIRNWKKKDITNLYAKLLIEKSSLSPSVIETSVIEAEIIVGMWQMLQEIYPTSTLAELISIKDFPNIINLSPEKVELTVTYRTKAKKLAMAMLKKWDMQISLNEFDHIIDFCLFSSAARFDPSFGASFMTFLYFHLKAYMLAAIFHDIKYSGYPPHSIPWSTVDEMKCV